MRLVDPSNNCKLLESIKTKMQNLFLFGEMINKFTCFNIVFGPFFVLVQMG
jgi:hypothetical protein